MTKNLFLVTLVYMDHGTKGFDAAERDADLNDFFMPIMQELYFQRYVKLLSL